jgi:hypothetical protein
MSVSMTITNTTAATIQLTELYTEVGPTGTANASVTVTRALADIDRMIALKTLLNAGSVTIDLVQSSDNPGVMSIPATQYGTAANMSVIATGNVTQAVVFPDAYDASATPNVMVCLSKQSNATTIVAGVAAQAITNTGFTAVLDVSTDKTNSVSTEAVVWSPAPNGTLLGPFTGTVAHPPITSAAITLNWTESTVAKTATVTGTSTIGGSNAANLSAASVNRTTGVIVLTFATSHPPDASSLTVSYAQQFYANVNWIAQY